MTNFRCPNCEAKIPFKELFQFKKNHKTECNNCGTVLVPKKPKSWNWGFFFGFVSFIIPAKIVLHFHDSFLIAALVGGFFAIITILIIALYTYSTAEFIKD